MKKNPKKKKRFISFFFKRLFMILIVACSLFCLTIYFGTQRKMEEICRNENNKYGTIGFLEDLNNADQKNQTSLFLASNTNYDPATPAVESALVLYNPKTGELITSDPVAIAEIWHDGKLRPYQLNDPSLIDILQDSAGYYFPGDIRVYSIYIKYDKFMPGEVYMQEKRIFPLPISMDESTKIQGKWVDLSPENTEGWTKICSDFSKESLSMYYRHDDSVHYDSLESAISEWEKDDSAHLWDIFTLGPSNSPRSRDLIEQIRYQVPKIREDRKEWYDGLKSKYETASIVDLEDNPYNTTNKEEILEKINQTYIASLRDLPKEVLHDDYNFRDTNRSLYYQDGIDLIPFRGETWELYHFVCINPRLVCFEFPYPVAFVIYGPFVLLALVIMALIWSVISYLIYSKRFEITAYRRNLTGALAHDLKTPLAVIYGNAENLRTHTHPENSDEYADCIMENVQHIDNMITDVLGLSQLEEKIVPKMKENVDLSSLFHEAFLRNETLMKQRSLTLSESGKLVLKGNSEMLTQLAENLVANAIQHTSDGGRISVTAEYRKLRISNPYTGSLDVKKICEPFQRGDAARGSHSGSGLGLSIVKQIASLHKIKLRITTKDGIFTAELLK